MIAFGPAGQPNPARTLTQRENHQHLSARLIEKMDMKNNAELTRNALEKEWFIEKSESVARR